MRNEPTPAFTGRTRARAPAPGPTNIGPPCQVSLMIPPLDLSDEAVDELAGRLADRMELAVVQRAEPWIFEMMRDGRCDMVWPYTTSASSCVVMFAEKRGDQLEIGLSINGGSYTQRFRFLPVPT